MITINHREESSNLTVKKPDGRLLKQAIKENLPSTGTNCQDTTWLLGCGAGGHSVASVARWAKPHRLNLITKQLQTTPD